MAVCIICGKLIKGIVMACACGHAACTSCDKYRREEVDGKMRELHGVGTEKHKEG